MKFAGKHKFTILGAFGEENITKFLKYHAFNHPLDHISLFYGIFVTVTVVYA